MNKCKECCITVTFIFYMIFTIICLIFVILDFKIKPNNEIRTAINSVVLILLVSEKVILILCVKFEIIFLYLLNIFIFIIEISLELYLQEYLPNDASYLDAKRIYNLLTAIFLIPLLICYLIMGSFEEKNESDPYVIIPELFVTIFCCCKNKRNIDEAIEELDKTINELNNEIKKNQNKFKDLDKKNKKILKDIQEKKQDLNSLIENQKEIKININRIINDEKKFKEKKDENIKLYNDITKEIENVEEKINHYKMILFKEKIYKNKNL